MRRRTFLTLEREGIKASESVAGDICLYNKTTSKLLILKNSDFNIDTYPSDIYIPVGVVVVPGNHNVYGDGSCAVIAKESLYAYDSYGGKQYSMYFGEEVDIETLKNFPKIVYCGEDNEITGNTVIGVQIYSTMLPKDTHGIYYVKCTHDSDAFYNLTNGVQLLDFAPSPYLTNNNRNPTYYQTSSPSSSENCLSDFDGRGNTDKILAVRGEKDYSTWKPGYLTKEDYPAASVCDMYYTEGTKQGDWYLPSCGELGYILPKTKVINNAFYNLIGKQVIGSSDLWSSTEKSGSYCCVIRLSTGEVELSDCQKNVEKYSVYPFLRIK